MSARISEREARRAGLLPAKRPPKVRPFPRDGAESRCVDHDVRFTSDAAETRHVNEVGGGHRIESVL